MCLRYIKIKLIMLANPVKNALYLFGRYEYHFDRFDHFL